MNLRVEVRMSTARITTKRIAPTSCLIAVLLACSLGLAQTPSFQRGVEVLKFPAAIDEISGLAQSRTNPDIFWVHNDSGDTARVFAVNRQGVLVGTYSLDGAEAVDWEDMAIAPVPGTNEFYLYLADCGDNNSSRRSIRIYRVHEPKVDPSQAPVTSKLEGVEAFDFIYDDGPRDAESFMVDPLTSDFYIISKRDQLNRLYRAVAPLPGKMNTFRFELTLPFRYSTSADISADGLQILIRRYSNQPGEATGTGMFNAPAETAASYWKRRDGSTSVVDLLRQPAEILPLVIEPQGEAIAFSWDGQGFYTTTERGMGASAIPASPLTFYSRSELKD
jgi:hypothetical protein